MLITPAPMFSAATMLTAAPTLIATPLTFVLSRLCNAVLPAALTLTASPLAFVLSRLGNAVLPAAPLASVLNVLSSAVPRGVVAVSG